MLKIGYYMWIVVQSSGICSYLSKCLAVLRNHSFTVSTINWLYCCFTSTVNI